MKQNIYIGIDPGKTGAMAVIFGEVRFEVYDFEDQNALLLLRDLYIDPLGVYRIRAVIEKVNARPGQGVVSMFSFGSNYGQWIGRIEFCGFPYSLVTPQKWRKEVFDSEKSKRGLDKKAISLEQARRLFPSMSSELKRKKDHGRAEALLIAEYCRRMDYLNNDK